MLDRAIKYRAAFSNLKVIDAKNYKYNLTEDEWKRVKQLCDFLEPFNEITRLISCSTYRTSNMYFMQVWKIKMWLNEHENSRDDTIKDMIVPMQEKFDKYWEEVSDIFAMATMLDPRMKLALAEFCFAKLDQRNCLVKMEHLRGKLDTLLRTYESNEKSPSSFSSTREFSRE